jgi:hypothetical protein
MLNVREWESCTFEREFFFVAVGLVRLGLGLGKMQVCVPVGRGSDARDVNFETCLDGDNRAALIRLLTPSHSMAHRVVSWALLALLVGSALAVVLVGTLLRKLSMLWIAVIGVVGVVASILFPLVNSLEWRRCTRDVLPDLVVQANTTLPRGARCYVPDPDVYLVFLDLSLEYCHSRDMTPQRSFGLFWTSKRRICEKFCLSIAHLINEQQWRSILDLCGSLPLWRVSVSLRRTLIGGQLLIFLCALVAVIVSNSFSAAAITIFGLAGLALLILTVSLGSRVTYQRVMATFYRFRDHLQDLNDDRAPYVIVVKNPLETSAGLLRALSLWFCVLSWDEPSISLEARTSASRGDYNEEDIESARLLGTH